MQNYNIKVHETNLKEMRNKLSLANNIKIKKLDNEFYNISYCI
jgi:hypothetical protein